MWVDALRVCRDYLPNLYPSLQAEYSSTNSEKNTDVTIESLLSRANEWTLAGQHVQAVECLLQVNESITDRSIVKRALLRAADTVNKFLFGEEALQIIKVLSPRYGLSGKTNGSRDTSVDGLIPRTVVLVFDVNIIVLVQINRSWRSKRGSSVIPKRRACKRSHRHFNTDGRME